MIPENLLSDPVGMIAVLLGFGGLLILAAYGLWRLQIEMVKRGVHPAVVEALSKAISLAWKTSENAVRAGKEGLSSLDKKQIADNFYDTGGDLLVDLQLKYLPYSIDLRDYITRDRWSELVQQQFNKMTAGLDDLLDLMGPGLPGRQRSPFTPIAPRRAPRPRDNRWN